MKISSLNNILIVLFQKLYLRHILPRKSLLTIYNTILKTLLNYGDIIYDQPHNGSFCGKLESVEYKAH